MSFRTTFIEGKSTHGSVDLHSYANDFLDQSSAVVNAGDMAVTQNSPLAMSVLVAAGTLYHYISSNGSYYRHKLTDATTSLAIGGNSSGSTRIDLVCVKTDLTVTPDANGGGVVSLVIVAGTAGAGVPATPANHYKLAEVTVANGAANITNANITDRRNVIKLNSALSSYANLNAPQGFLLNGKIVATVASNNLTVAIKGLDGNNPSASNPIYVRIGDTIRTITNTLSVTKNAGTNWFNAGGTELATKETDYFVYLGYNATDGITIGFSRIPYANRYGDFSATTTNEKYAAISNITNAASTDYYENIGRFAATLSAGAGYTWTVPTFTASNLFNRPTFETRWLDYAPAWSGFSANPTYTFKYKIRDRQAFIKQEGGGSAGTSNATSFGFTLPLSSLVGMTLAAWVAVGDNGSNQSTPGHLEIQSAGINISVWKTYYQGNFTNSGGKGVFSPIFSYEI